MKRRLPAILLALACVLCICACRSTSNDLGDEAFWWTDDALIRKKCVPFFEMDLMPIADNAPQINDYHFSVEHGLHSDTIQLFVDCTYSEADYEKETVRLDSLGDCWFGKVDDGEQHSFDETRRYDSGFNYPAIVKVYMEGEGCMYALLSESEHRIIYVFLQYEDLYSVLFDKKYLPQDENGEPVTLYTPPA